ncbi:lipopolysaccharide transport periplasmic protein LptA [Kushneria sp. TE3]|uniref:lipopolysaccharide transport periplasmic protein LptA n=1 Tax=Kushneria sp. TE3 TaxID=3449832 RepID=UPI003F683C2B
MIRPVLLCTSALLLALLGQQAMALESDRQKPINIGADELNIDNRAGTAVYTGTVEVDQGTMKLRSSQVELKRAQSGGLSSLTAKGGSGGRAYIEQQPAPNDPLAKGWGNTIIYHAGERRVELIGNAELHQSGDTFNGGYVEYFLDSRQVNARGNQSTQGSSSSDSSSGGRVRMQLTPEDQQGSSN